MTLADRFHRRRTSVRRHVIRAYSRLEPQGRCRGGTDHNKNYIFTVWKWTHILSKAGIFYYYRAVHFMKKMVLGCSYSLNQRKMLTAYYMKYGSNSDTYKE